MRFCKAFSAACLLLSCWLGAFAQTNESPLSTRVVAYYTAWSIYARNFNVADIPADKVTHINYAFANISAGGEIAIGDSWSDVEKAFPGDTWDQPLRGNFNQLLKLKQQHPSSQDPDLRGWLDLVGPLLGCSPDALLAVALCRLLHPLHPGLRFRRRGPGLGIPRRRRSGLQHHPPRGQAQLHPFAGRTAHATG